MKNRAIPRFLGPVLALSAAALVLPIAGQDTKTPAAEEEKAKDAQEAKIAADKIEEKEEEEADAAVDNLATAAQKFVEAYNKKDAAAIAALFLPTGELIDRDGKSIRGRDAIAAHYKEIFEDDDVPQVALEASKVRMVTPDIVLEDGTVHFTATEDDPVRSIRYSAVQVKQPDGSWLLANTRDLEEVTPPSERIKSLQWILGDWTLESDGTKTNISFELDESGNFIVGDAITMQANNEDESQTSTIRIGWNPACDSVYWWTFDSEGGNSSGTWTPVGKQWLVHTSGVTADGETIVATQKLSADGKDTIVWAVSDKVIDGEPQPNKTVRFVRHAPLADSGQKDASQEDSPKK